MKILVISSMANYHYDKRIVGGVERCVEVMSQQLHEMGHDVTCVMYAKDEMKRDYKTVVVRDILSDESISPGKRKSYVLDVITRLCQQNRYDCIINNSERYWSIMFELDKMYAAFETKPKMVHIEHSISEFYKSMSRFARFGKMVYAKKLGHSIYLSCKHFLKDWPLAMIGKHNIVMQKMESKSGCLITQADIDKVTSLDDVYQAAYIDHHPALDHSGRGIFIGRASTMKNPLLAAETFQALGVKADFFLASASVNVDEQKIMEKLKSFDVVTVHENRPREELLDTLRKAKFLIVCGLDSFCLVGLEAATYGVPTLFMNKNNFVSKLPVKYDYTNEFNNFYIDTHKKDKSVIMEEAKHHVDAMPNTAKERQKIVDATYAEYNSATFRECMTKIIS